MRDPDPVTLRSLVSTSCLVGLLVLGASYAQGQAGSLRGFITDSAGHPLANSEVRIMSESRVAHTDSVGAFVLYQLRSRVVEVSVRHMGYQMKVIHVALANSGGDTIRVGLVAEPILLQSVDVESRNTEGSNNPFFVAFERRRSLGVGRFITQDQIDKLNTSYPSDAFRGLSGVQLVSAHGGFGVRFASSTGIRGRGSNGCTPMIWVDGQRAPNMEIDELRAQDIHGIEIYHGASTLPHEFSTPGLTQCGAIVVWTRRK